MIKATILSAIMAFGPQEQCQLDNIFFEAVGEPLIGQILVANTVKNRLKNPRRWGSTPCEVIYQPSQFSWTAASSHKLKEFKNAEEESYINLALSLENILAYGSVPGFEGVNHFIRCDYRHVVSWENNMVFLGKVGAHCFYRD